VQHGDHFDYLVGRYLHHNQDGRCDVHGSLVLAGEEEEEAHGGKLGSRRGEGAAGSSGRGRGHGHSHGHMGESDEDAASAAPRALAPSPQHSDGEEDEGVPALALRRRNAQMMNALAGAARGGSGGGGGGTPGAHAAASASGGKPLAWHQDRDALRFVAMMALSGGFMVVELAVGVIIRSLALQADAYHMASDVIAVAIGAYAVRAAKRRHSSTATYGLTRWEVVGSLVNAVFLLSTCFTIALEALQRFSEAQETLAHLAPDVDLLLIVGGAGLAMNLIAMVVLSAGHGHGHAHGGGSGGGGSHGHSHGGAAPAPAPAPAASSHGHGGSSGHGHSHMSMNIQGVLLHVLGDALGSVGVIISGLVIKYTDWEWRGVVDPICSLAIVAIIVAGTVPLLRRSLNILLQKVPLHVDVAGLRARVLAIPGVLSCHDLHVWQLNDTKVIGSMHVILDRRRGASYRRITDEIKVLLHGAGVHASTVQPEFVSVALQARIEAAAAAVRAAEEADAAAAAAAGASGGGGAPGGDGGGSSAARSRTPLPAPSPPPAALRQVAVVAAGALAGVSSPSGEAGAGDEEAGRLPAASPGAPPPIFAPGGTAPGAEPDAADLLLLDMCDEIVCGDGCTAASCCPAPPGLVTPPRPVGGPAVTAARGARPPPAQTTADAPGM
jgi:zinc transporter 1